MFDILIDLYFEKQRLSNQKINDIFSRALKQIDKDRHFNVKVHIESEPIINIDGKRRSHLTFLEVSNRHPLIMFNSGYLVGKNATLKFIKEEKDSTKADLPIPISNNSIFAHDLDALLKDETFDTELKLLLNNIINNYFKFKNHLEKFWFKTSEFKIINVIGAPDFDPNGKGQVQTPLDSRNEDIYDFGDKDTFIDACMFLARHYPDSILERKSSQEKVEENGNMLIIGGPGSDEDLGNVYCKQYMDLVGSKIRYAVESNKEFVLVANGIPYRSTQTKDGLRLQSDYGYFACFTNPHTPTNRIVLINGIHTLGVLGAFLAFSDNPTASLNYKTVLKKAIKDKEQQEKLKMNEMLDFECFFEVTKSSSNKPNVPKILSENIFFVQREKKRNGRKATDKISKPNPNIEKLKQEISAALIEASHESLNKKEVAALVSIYKVKVSGLTKTTLDKIWKIIDNNRSLPLRDINLINTLLYA